MAKKDAKETMDGTFYNAVKYVILGPEVSQENSGNASEEKANGGGDHPEKQPTMHPEDPADEQPEPAREKGGDNDTDEVDQGVTSIQETGNPEKIPGALRPINIASGKESASSRLSTSVLAIPSSVFRKVCILLNTKDEISFHDFRMLGEKLGYNKTVTRALEDETTANPTDELLWDWSTADEVTVGKLIKILKEKDLERMDVVSVLESWLKRDRNSGLSTKVIDIPCDVYSEICLKLNVKYTWWKDYRVLGDKLKYSRVQMEGFEQGNTNPTGKLIKKACQRKGGTLTVARFIALMKEMERIDVVETLEDWVYRGLAGK